MKREGPSSSDGAEKHTKQQYNQYLGILAFFGIAYICKEQQIQHRLYSSASRS